jgi:hypothetical protein
VGAMDVDSNQAPKTVAEIGIHIGYIREDLKSIKNSLSNTPNRTEFESLSKRVCAVEGVINSIKNRIVVSAITILVIMILAQYGISQYFKG